jgi:hypothetical protein
MANIPSDDEILKIKTKHEYQGDLEPFLVIHKSEPDLSWVLVALNEGTTPRLGMRLFTYKNGCPSIGNENEKENNKPEKTWFIVPKELNNAILDASLSPSPCEKKDDIKKYLAGDMQGKALAEKYKNYC